MRYAAIMFVLGAAVATTAAKDWPHWRGPAQTGAAPEKAVVTEWSPEGQNLAWKSDVGGRTTPIVMWGRLFTIAPVGEGLCLRERVVCLDTKTGQTLWENALNVFDTDIVEQRLGWTALAGDPQTGGIYAHTTGGEFICFDGNGEIIWKHSLTEEYGRISGYGGRIQTPIVDEDRVIISFLNTSWGDQGKPLHRYVAFDKKTGKVLWWAAPGEAPLDTTYSTPVVATINGVRQLIAGNADGNVYGLNARSGEKLWTFKFSKRGINVSPVADGNFVYIAHSEENISGNAMGRIVCIDASKSGDITDTGEVWRADGNTTGYASPAVANGRAYFVDNSATLFCFDAKTGKEHWRFGLGRVGKGSPTITSDGVIYVGEQNGIFHILKDAGDKCEQLDKDEFPPRGTAIDEIYGSPVIVDGRVYFMTRYATYCLGIDGAPVIKTDTPPPAAATAGNEKLQIVPADVSAAPGEVVRFSVRLAGGPEEKTPAGKVEWAAAGVNAKIAEDGTLTIAADELFSVGAVTAKADGQSATARIRVTPRLPITETFDSYAPESVPPGWVGVGRRAAIVERDGSRVLKKLATDSSPPFIKIRPYFGTPIAGGYTVQCDLLGRPREDGRFKPDMGVINTRYMVYLIGNEQQLRIESWATQPRVRHDVPFAWSTDTWYRMKCRVEPAGGKAVIRAKVWPREATEPAEWSIEFTDPCPNEEGCAGLFGYSPGTTLRKAGPEIFYDNLSITRNE